MSRVIAKHETPGPPTRGLATKRIVDHLPLKEPANNLRSVSFLPPFSPVRCIVSSLRTSLRRLHKDENGMEAMQAVIIVGVAAVVLALIFNYRTTLMKKVESLINKILK